jgi:hypothetical protein
MIEFVRVWCMGYVNPFRCIEGLRDKPAPQWGFYAQFLRAVLDSLLLYLPLSLLGRTPPTPSNLTAVPTETYFGALVWMTPLVLFAQWLLGGGMMHMILRLVGRHSNFDQILNLTGMATLVVGAFLLAWDWLWIVMGGIDQYGLGISHLLIDFWGGVIVVLGLRKILGVPAWLGVMLYVLGIAIGLPLGIMFMRSPI